MASEEIYQKPIPPLARLVDQPKLPGARISPDYQWICFLQRPGLESIEDLAGPELKLAGLRFNPERYAPSSAGFTYDSMTLHHLESGREFEVQGIAKGKIHVPSWSPDSKYLVFTLEQSDGLRLWSLKAGEDTAQELCPLRVNGVLPGGFYRWSPDSESVLTRLVVEKPAPEQSSVPAGPIVRETSGEKSPLRTYQDLLKDESDSQLFEHYATSQLARVKLSGEIVLLGEPAANYSYRSSPNAEYILRKKLLRPYSFLVPSSRFAGAYELLDGQGELLKLLVEFPAAEELPKGFDSVLTGPRQYDWRDDAPATLVWAEALDGGDMKAELEFHDRVFFAEAPFQEAQKFLDLELRFDGIEWAHEGLALVSEWRYSDRRTRTWAVSPAQPKVCLRLFDDRSFNDHYRDPGQALRVNGTFGTRVLASVNSGRDLLLAGRGASPAGCIPFLDRWNSESGQSERLWASQAPYYERVMGLLDNEGHRILTLRESVDEPPNFFVRDLKHNQLQALTSLPHPTPDFRHIQKELITYRRKDGVELSATLYLPPNYQGGPLPVVMWAYPLEYKSPEVAGQMTTSPFEFNRVSYWGPLPFLSMGWAVLDDPKMPIVGLQEQLPNDTFLEQLISSAEAAVETLVERGVSDGKRLAIGGHSYGAFMVANLLAHSELFATGIARSGAYNRSLTPFGFQGEERDFWEGQAVYSEMSPFFSADKIKKPILIIHGAEDNNAGTYPMQSERFFAAIKGLGGQARLVLLPKESHVYRARESLLHMLWEQQEWLKKYL